MTIICNRSLLEITYFPVRRAKCEIVTESGNMRDNANTFSIVTKITQMPLVHYIIDVRMWIVQKLNDCSFSLLFDE